MLAAFAVVSGRVDGFGFAPPAAHLAGVLAAPPFQARAARRWPSRGAVGKVFGLRRESVLPVVVHGEDHLSVKHFRVDEPLEPLVSLVAPRLAPAVLFEIKEKRNNIKMCVRRFFVHSERLG